MKAEIRRRADACGIHLDDAGVSALAGHAGAVLRANSRLNLTAITEPGPFVERHIGESLEGAALLDPEVNGWLLDVGSGNGYPGLPVCIARPGLRPLLAEARSKKAAFLREVVAEHTPNGEVLHGRVDRPADLGERQPLRLIVTRAAGGWEKFLPRMAGSLTADGQLLVWAGREMETIARRSAWDRFNLEARQALPGRDASWIWLFRKLHR